MITIINFDLIFTPPFHTQTTQTQMGKRNSSPSSSFLTPNKLFKKAHIFYIRDFESNDQMINVCTFKKGTTLHSAILSTIPELLDTGSLFAIEKDNHKYNEILTSTLLNQISSGTVIVPVYRFHIFRNKEFLIPRSFTGYELALYIKQNYLPNLNPSQLYNFTIDSKEINTKIPLYHQTNKDSLSITFLSSDEDEDALGEDENCENAEHNTQLPFEFVSLCSEKEHYHIPAGTTFSQLKMMQTPINSLMKFLEEKHFSTIAHTDFEMCYLDSKGRITPIPKSQQTVDQIPQPRILLWRYKHCSETFDKYLRSYIFDTTSNKSKCLTFLSETMFVVVSPEEQVFGPIYNLFNGTEVDDSDEMIISKIKDLISHLKTKAQLFFDCTNYKRLISNLTKDYETLPYVPK